MIPNEQNNNNNKDQDKTQEIEKIEKIHEIQKEEEEIKAHSSGMYGLDIIQIEKLMGYYKERGANFLDLETIKEMGGPEGIMSKLKTDPKTGISSTENRENDFGSNKVFIEPVPPFCSYVCEALEDLMVRILIAAAVVQIILGVTLGEDPTKDWIDGLSIIIAVLVVTLVGSITNYQKETKFHELNAVQNEGTIYKVIRNGVPETMKSDDILVGDLINIMVGDIMPSDIILIEGNGIKMDESSLTGESDSLRKEPYEKCVLIKNENSSSKVPSPLMLSGTNCVEGTGFGIVLAVGDHCQKGIIRRTVDNAQENSQTPLEKKLEDIAEKIGLFGMIAGIVTLVALTIRFIIHYLKNDKKYRKDSAMKDIVNAYLMNFPNYLYNSEIKNEANIHLTNPSSEISANVLNIIMLCVSIIVVAIPEGLPLAVTLSLAFSIKKLMDFKNLVRKMHACETMGGANYICTDKTGTLTKNEMNVFRVLTAKGQIELKETIEDNETKALDKNKNIKNELKIREQHDIYFKNSNYWDQLRIAVALNVDGQIKELENPDINGDTESCETKNKTDKAFIDFLYRFKVSISEERAKYTSNKKFYKQIPFDSKRKRMTTFIKHDLSQTGYRLYTKGGAEKVNVYCKNYLDPETGLVKPLGDTERYFISDSVQQFNKQMLRSLYICYKDILEDEFENAEKFKNSDGKALDQYDLTFIACVGIRDSLRNGVKDAVAKCHSAGVNVIMVTGDNIITATAIAKDCGILGQDVNLDNLQPGDIEQEPELTENPERRAGHIQNILETKPKALTGNTFYSAIGGLICSTCGLDSNLCKCPKTEAEAEQIANKTGKPKSKIKNDTIKDKVKFQELSKNLKVMARSQPIHKYALVLGLRELDKIVAVTGDGTNDAPALSKSDVGFAMFDGTDIAKEASDIVILDNNFSSLVIAIIYGRNIYDNIRKFLQFQLTVNFCACLLVFICACIGNETPLTTIQMLWINLIMDSLGSLALATEPPYEELLKREPTRKEESIINGKMWKHIGFQSIIELVLLILLYLYAPYFIKEDDVVRLAENHIIDYCYDEFPGGTSPKNIIFGTSPKWDNSIKKKLTATVNFCGAYFEKNDLSLAYEEYTRANAGTAHMSIVFNVFVIYTLFNQFNCRVIDDSLNIFVRMGNNLFFPVITLCELALQILLIEFGRDAFKCTERGLTLIQWLIVIGFSAVTIVLSAIVKFIPIDVPIQNYLDKPSDNKVANLEDLVKETSVKEPVNVTEKHGVSVNYQKNMEDLKGSKILQGSIIIKSMRRNSSYNIGGRSMRQKKPSIHVSNE
jgi:Ca2+ transporting ATPase